MAPVRARLSEAWLTPTRLLALVAVLVGAYLALVVVRALRDLLVILLVSLFLACAMEPAVQFLGRRGWRRGAATGAVFAVGFLVTVGIVAAMAPLVVTQVQGLLASFPRSLEEAAALLRQLPLGIDLEASPELAGELEDLGQQATAQVRDVALGAAGNVLNLGATAVGALFQMLTVLLVTFYLVADGPRFRRTLARPFPPERQHELLAIWELAVAKTGGYIYSRLLLAVVCAVAHFAFLWMLGVPYPIPLGLWVGITSAFVPVVGTYLGGVLLLIVAATNEPTDALWVLAFIALYQQLENYVLAPRVQARTMDVHPAVAFVCVLAGGTLLGAVGALLALPATAIIQALLSTYVRRHQIIDELAEVDLPGGPVTVPGDQRRTQEVRA